MLSTTHIGARDSFILVGAHTLTPVDSTQGGGPPHREVLGVADVSIVIVSWNARPWLERCLRSVAAELDRLPSVSAEVFVVDNGSTDGSVANVRERHPAVRWILNRTNRGFAAATNQGIGQAAGEALLLLNPDAELRPGALEFLLRHLKENPRVAAIGPRLIDGDGRFQESTSSFPTLWSECLRLFHLNGPWLRSKRTSLDAPRTVDVVQGACLLLRGQALDQVGLLDEAFFMYSEEVDLAWRLQKKDWETVWLPTATVVHHGGRSTEQRPQRMFLELYRSKIVLFRKHRGLAVAVLYKLVFASAALARIVLLPFSLLETPVARRRHWELGRCYGLLLRKVWSF